MSYYGEYLERSNWKKSDLLQKWLVKRVLLTAVRISGIEISSTKCLEIGSGIGRGGDVSRQLGFHDYVGIEPAEVLADYCREEKKLKVLNDSLPNLISIENESFDFCFSIHVLEHSPSHLDARLWVKEMLRVIKPGGFCLVVAPDIKDWKEYFWDSDWSHGFPTSPRRVGQIFDDLQADCVYNGTMHLGSVNLIAAVTAHAIGAILPTRIIDRITLRAINRPLASGLNFALLYGLTFSLFQKKNSELS